VAPPKDAFVRGGAVSFVTTRVGVSLMTKENDGLIRRWFAEVWNQGRVEAIDEMFAADGVAHGLSNDSGNPLRGPVGFREFHARFREAFPDIVVTVEDTIAEDDKIAARCIVRGKHAGDSMGFAPTQAQMEINRNQHRANQRRKNC